MKLVFENPSLLIFLILLIPVVLLIWRGYRKRQRLLSSFSGAKVQLTGRSIIVIVFSVILLASFLIIAAGPRRLLDDGEQDRSANFVFLIDVSRSMAARSDCDEATRLQRARSIMERIVRELPGARYGFMAFARLSFVLSEPGYERQYLLEVIRNGIFIEVVPFPGSDISNALHVFLEKKNETPRVFEQIDNIILFSDGDFATEDLQDLDTAISRLRDAGVKITSIGVGSEQGTPIPTLNASRECIEGQFERADGKEFYTHLVEDQLRFLAVETEGAYFHETEQAGLLPYLKSEFERIEGIEPPLQSEDATVLFLSLATFSFLLLVLLRYL